MPIMKLFILGALSFGLSYLITPLTIPLCKRIGAIDIPDGIRKINTAPTPRLGGLAFFASVFIILAPFASRDASISAMLTAGAILVAGGIADDSFGLSPFLKLAIQAVSALVAVSIIGIPERFSFFGVLDIGLFGLFGFLFAVGRMIFTINAVNFSDGLDGLASGLSMVALFSLFLFGRANSAGLPSLAALVLGFAVLGFLPYNKYHAQTFMGDCGSQFLGLSIAILSLGNAESNSYSAETTLFLAIPALDTALSVVRRILKRKSPFSADKGHLHHILLNFGVPHPLAANLLITASCAVALVTLYFVL